MLMNCTIRTRDDYDIEEDHILEERETRYIDDGTSLAVTGWGEGYGNLVGSNTGSFDVDLGIIEKKDLLFSGFKFNTLH